MYGGPGSLPKQPLQRELGEAAAKVTNGSASQRISSVYWLSQCAVVLMDPCRLCVLLRLQTSAPLDMLGSLGLWREQRLLIHATCFLCPWKPNVAVGPLRLPNRNGIHCSVERSFQETTSDYFLV